MVELNATKINALDRIYKIFEKSFKLNHKFSREYTISLFGRAYLVISIIVQIKKQPAEVSLPKKLPRNIRIALLMNICKFDKTGFDLPIFGIFV